METASLSVEGKGVGRLVGLLRGRLEGDGKRCYAFAAGKVCVLAYETYYFRIGSNLFTVAVLDMREEGSCSVEVTSGGGTQGLLGIGWGAEADANRSLSDAVAAICEDEGWELTEVGADEDEEEEGEEAEDEGSDEREPQGGEPGEEGDGG
jgi:hypothetical protein